MKNIMLLVSILQCLLIFGQTPPKFNASNTAGIFYYNTTEVTKKVKIKDKDVKIKTSNALKLYNGKVKKISFLNTFKLKELDVLVNRLNNNIATISDDEKINTTKKVQDVLIPVMDSIVSYEKELNLTLEKFLSSKQNKKWLKYQKKQKKDLLPEIKNDPHREYQNRNRRIQNRSNRRY